MISEYKKYRTRSGEKVVIYTDRHPNDYPIVGRVGTDVMLWDINGLYRSDKTESQFDLIEVIEPKQYTAQNINTYNFEQLSGVAKMCMDRMLELSKK
jgi:hypothetical protein